MTITTIDAKLSMSALGHLGLWKSVPAYICQHGIGSIVWRHIVLRRRRRPPGAYLGEGGGGIFGRERPVRHLSMFLHSLPLWGVNIHTSIIVDTIIITHITIVSAIINGHQQTPIIDDQPRSLITRLADYVACRHLQLGEEGGTSPGAAHHL